jgi:integrase
VSARKPAAAGQASLLAAVRHLAAVSAQPGEAADTAAVGRHLEWMRLRGISPHVIYKRRRMLAKLRAFLPGPVLAASPADILAWRASMTTYTPETIVLYVSHVRCFYRWAAETGLIAESPAAAVPVPRQRKRLPRPIAEADLFAALDSAPARIRVWLVLAGWAGLRAQEIARLRREDVQEHRCPPVLIVTSLAAKGQKERVVPLSPFVLAELAAAALPVSGWAFPRGDGRPGPNAPSTISHLANGCLHDAGIAATLHQCRHRFASQLYRQTRDLRLVQDTLGHENLGTTAGYSAWDRAQAPEAVSALPVPSGRAGRG